MPVAPVTAIIGLDIVFERKLSLFDEVMKILNLGDGWVDLPYISRHSIARPQIGQ